MLLWLYIMMIWWRDFDVSYLFSFDAWRFIYIYIQLDYTYSHDTLNERFVRVFSESDSILSIPIFSYIGNIISLSLYLILFATMKHFLCPEILFLLYPCRAIIRKKTKKCSFIVRIGSDVFCRYEINIGSEISFISTWFFKIFRNDN